MNTTPLFSLGQVVATPGALELLQAKQEAPMTYLQRHVTGDWGDVCSADKALNDDAIKPATQSRVMSVYTIGADKIWIITEWDRSVTTILLPSEY